MYLAFDWISLISSRKKIYNFLKCYIIKENDFFLNIQNKPMKIKWERGIFLFIFIFSVVGGACTMR